MPLAMKSPSPTPRPSSPCALPVAIEEMRQVLLRDSRAVVGHGEADVPGARPRTDMNGSTDRDGLHGIADQVRQHLHDALGVGPDRGEIPRDLPLDAHRLAGRQALERVQRFVDDGTDILSTRLDREHARLDRRRLEKIVDQALHPFGRAKDQVQLLAARAPLGAGGSARQMLRAKLDRRQGAPQIVRDDGEQVVSRPDRGAKVFLSSKYIRSVLVFGDVHDDTRHPKRRPLDIARRDAPHGAEPAVLTRSLFARYSTTALRGLATKMLPHRPSRPSEGRLDERCRRRSWLGRYAFSGYPINCQYRGLR